MEVNGEIHVLVALPLGKQPQYLMSWKMAPRAGPDVSKNRKCLAFTKTRTPKQSMHT